MVPKPQKPGRSPSLTDVRPLSPTSLRLGWVLLDSKTNEEIEGYFIYYKPSVSDEKYKKITILGATSHSFIIYGLIPGTEYDLKVMQLKYTYYSSTGCQVFKREKQNQLREEIFEF